MPTSDSNTDAVPSDTTSEEVLLSAAFDRNTEIDPDAEVVLKAEWHFSTGDLREELALIRTGAFDTVIFEAARENAEEITTSTISDRIVAFPLFVLDFLYTDSMPLFVAALTQGADLRFTRDTDGDVIQDLPDILHGAILGLVLILGASIGYFAARAISQPHFVTASLTAFVLLFALPITVRLARGKLASDDLNRNEIMARRIEAALDETDGGRVFVPVGARHANPVCDRLSDDVEVSVVSPAYGFVSIPAMREFVPGAVKSIVLFIAVWVALAGGGALAVLAVYPVITGVV